jgi:hypothetical protein
MSVLGKLFGTKEVVSGGMELADKAFYTSEERDENTIKKISLKAGILKAYEPFKIAQRLLAMVTAIPYSAAWVATFAVSFFGIDTSNQERLLAGDMGAIVKIIVGFYFCGGTIESTVKIFSALKKQDK